MANSLYDKGRQRFLEAQLNWITDDIKVVMVDTALYTFAASHEFLSSIAAEARVTAPTTLTSKTSTNGAADAQDATFAAVNGPSIEALVLYKQVLALDGVTPDDTASILIAYIDTATGLPITPNGGDIIVTWDNGINKIFRL
jgi:hypothetical protein